MCDLCGHEEHLPEDQLCLVCREAIRRLAAAVNRLQGQAVEKTPSARGTVRNVEEYRTAFFDTRS